jgi:hypothetical protein
MPLLVTSSKCSSSGGPNCINTSSGITHTGGWLSDVPVKRKIFNTIWPSWWWALVARNMYRHEINTLRKSASSWSLTRITRYFRPTLNRLEFSGQIYVKYSTITCNFMKIRPVGAELFHANRRTDMNKLLAISRKLLEKKCENSFSVRKRISDFLHQAWDQLR